MNLLRLSFLFSVLCLFAFEASAQQDAASTDNSMTELQIPSGDINVLLDTYERMSGKTLIRDANIPAGINIRIVVDGKIPKAEAMRLLESVLLLNGYALVPSDDNSAKVVNASAGKNPRSEGITLYANLADLPKGDQVSSYFMQFKYMGAQEALGIVQAQIPLHPWGGLVAVPHAQAVVVTENASTIRQIARLKDLIDVPPAKLISQFVTLQRADAERVATLITKLIEDRKSKSQDAASPQAANTNGQPAPAPNTPQPAAASENSEINERSLVAGDVQLVADPRTNRILVVTRPVNFEYIKNLIGEFDNAAVLSAPLDRPLKYLVASEILPVLETMLLESADDKVKRSDESSSGGTQAGGAGGGNRAAGGGGGSGVSSSASASLDNSPTLQEKQNTAPEAVLVGKTRLIADNQANSIIVIGPPENIAKVRNILDSLDKKPMQVYLSTVIGQLSLNDSTETAVDLLHRYSKMGDFGLAGASRGRTDPIVDPASLTTVASLASIPAGLTIYGTIGSALDYYVKALASTNRFKLISRPVVYTTNNKLALIASGQRIAIPETTLTSQDSAVASNASVAATIGYTPVELKLEVVPTINSNREVTLKIKQSNDTVAGNTTISGNTVPNINTQSVESTITVTSGDTIVLGGLIMEDNTTTVNGIPYLKDIPVLGYLFKGTVKSKNRTELIILIQPVVVASTAEEILASQAEVDRNKFGPEAKAFSDNVPFIPDDKKKPIILKNPPKGLSPAPPANTPKTTPVTSTPDSRQTFP